MQLEDLANREMARKQDARRKNRRDFPQMANWIDVLREFNPRVIWAEEAGRSVGERGKT